MGETNESKSWFSTLPGLFSSLAALITAIGGILYFLQDKETGQDPPREQQHKEIKVQRSQRQSKASEISIYHCLGHVGKLSAHFQLEINYSKGRIEGTYYYPSRPGKNYLLSGTLKGRQMELSESLNNEITATCELELQDQHCYQGKMNNTDGRVLDMSICLNQQY